MVAFLLTTRLIRRYRFGKKSTYPLGPLYLKPDNALFNRQQPTLQQLTVDGVNHVVESIENLLRNRQTAEV